MQRAEVGEMQVYEWRSFSCNNSSDHRLVARFSSADKAEAAAKELKAFFKKHAKEIDRRVDEDDDFDAYENVSSTAQAMAEKYGFQWKSALFWGDEGLEGDEPQVKAIGESVALYHTYCSGYGSDVTNLIKALGGTIDREKEDREPPLLLARFRLPPGYAGEKFAAELSAFFGQSKTEKHLSDWKEGPLGSFEYGSAENVTWLSDGEQFSFVIPTSPMMFDDVKKALSKRKVGELELKIGTDQDVKNLKKEATKAQKTAAKLDPTAGASTKKAAGKAAAKTATLPTVGKKFLFTGKLATLTRDEGKARVKELGGVAASSVSADLDYLVIGDEGSPLFGEGAKGSKMIAVEKLIAKGASIQIISENTFLTLTKR